MHNLYIVVSHDNSMIVDIDTAEIDKELGLPCVEFELEVLTKSGLLTNAAVIGSDRLPASYLEHMKAVPLVQFINSEYVESSNISMLDLPSFNEGKPYKLDRKNSLKTAV